MTKNKMVIMNTLKHLLVHIKTGIILPVLLLFMQSCVKETIDFNKISKKVEWDPKLAIPLISDDITLKDIIEAADSKGYVKQYSNGLLYVVYEDDLVSDKAEDIIQIPNQPPFRDSIVASQVVPPVSQATVTKDSSYLSFAVNNSDALDSIFFKAGSISFSVNSTFPNNGSIVVVIDSLRKNNIPLTITANFTGGGGTVNVTPVNLDGYKLYLTRRNGQPNQIKYRYTLTLQPSGTAIQPGDKIVINSQLTNPAFSAIFGFISSFNLFNFTNENINLDIFELDQDASVQFADPRLKIYFTNTFGIPVSMSLSNVYTHADGSNTTYNLSVSPLYNPYAPAYVPSFSGFKPAYDTLLLDTSTINNLDKAIATVPQDFYFDASSTVNPSGMANSFLLDTSRLRAKIVVELPFDLRAQIYEISDTIDDLDLSTGIEDFSIIDSIKIYNYIENHIPFEVTCQIYFNDSANNKVDSLYSPVDQPIVASGTITNGRVTEATKKTTVSVFTGTRIKNLEKVKKGIIKFDIVTTNAGSEYVKFFITDNVKIKLGMQANAKVRSLDQL
jgi:hypothetical protein